MRRGEGQWAGSRPPALCGSEGEGGGEEEERGGGGVESVLGHEEGSNPGVRRRPRGSEVCEP